MDKEYISVCYIHDTVSGEDLSFFSKSNGFILQVLDDASLAVEAIRSSRPDLILIETDLINIETFGAVFQKKLNIPFSCNPVVFCVLKEFPDAQTRVKLYEAGINDILTVPFLIQEVKEKYKVYGQVVDLLQKSAEQEKKNEKSREYLDRFKNEVKKIKKELFDDRSSLNSALKQINEMTRERKRLKNEKALTKASLEENIQGFFEILCQLVEVKIEKNRGHGRRVSHIAGFLGKEFKLDGRQLDDLEKASMLHEAGLLFIPDEVMQKRDDELTEYEKDLFVQFPVKGADLLNCCSEFNSAAQIIRHMHENSDGSGTPEGLKRRYIPLMSRILAGADLFDTLKDKKEIKSLESFLEKLEEFSGSRLDPVVVGLLEKYAVLHMGSDNYMVKGVGIHQLEPGMTLGTAIFTNTGTKLFSVNTLLTLDAIDKIKKYNRAYPVDETVYIRA